MAKLVDVASIASYFESLDDPRHTRNRKHLPVDIAVIAVCAIPRGRDGPTAIHRWAKHRHPWLAQHLAPPNGIPSRDCIRRTLVVLRPETFRRGLPARIGDTIQPRTEAEAKLKPECESTDRLVAIDGQSCRGSHDQAKGLGASHIVSAWATERGVALGQVAAEAQSHEITAIPQPLKQIDLKGAPITTDAMGRQKEVVQQVVTGGGDCLIAVKDNRPQLAEAIQSLVIDRPGGDPTKSQHRSHETSETKHGRVDERSYHLAEVPKNFACRKDWPWIKAVGCTVRMRRH